MVPDLKGVCKNSMTDSTCRYDPYTTSYSSSYGSNYGGSSSSYGAGGTSAIDRYYSYLNDISVGSHSISNNALGSRLTNSYSSGSGSDFGSSSSSRRSYR